MKIVLPKILLLLSFSACQISSSSLNYLEKYEFRGQVMKVTYSINDSNIFETFILKTERSFFINAHEDLEAVKDVKEFHLNIENPKIEHLEGKNVKVYGKLFHALTAHHIRDACILVEKITEQ